MSEETRRIVEWLRAEIGDEMVGDDGIPSVGQVVMQMVVNGLERGDHLKPNAATPLPSADAD